ncbi:MAG: SAM-dependent chlorinase/fluorinase [Methanomassiliicoccales archaeon]
MSEELRRPVVTLLTDFGSGGGYIGAMKGVILRRVAADIVDITHAIPPQSIEAGALVLRSVAGFFPENTIHVVVIDPGVGSSRKAIAIHAGNHYFIGPDNGVLIPAARKAGKLDVREIDVRKIGLPEVSNTFHGRDVFAPAAAFLAAGSSFQKIGRSLSRYVPLEIEECRKVSGGLAGRIVYVDSFGNLLTGIPADTFKQVFSYGDRISLHLGDRRTMVQFKPTYASVDVGSPLILIGSHSFVEIAVRNGSALNFFEANPGQEVLFKKPVF